MDQEPQHLQADQIDGLIAAAGVDGTREIMDAFWRSTSELLDKLAGELAAAALDEAAKTSHAIKGSAANVGACRISKTAASMEVSCRNGEGADANNLLCAMREDFTAAQKIFDAHLQAAAA